MTATKSFSLKLPLMAARKLGALVHGDARGPHPVERAPSSSQNRAVVSSRPGPWGGL